MEITGKLIKIDNAQEGTSSKGPWRKALAIFETQEQYPKTIAVGFFNAKLDEATNIPLGTPCKVGFDIKSREYKGKWYTDLDGFSIEAVVVNPTSQPSFDRPIPQIDNDDLPY